MKIGERLKNIRKEKDLTQEELANLTSISASTISKIENGLIYPTVEQLNVICKAFNNEISDIIEGNERTLNQFAKTIAMGIFIILIGISLFLSFIIIFDNKVAITTLLISLLISAYFFSKKGNIINTKKEDYKKYSNYLVVSSLIIIMDIILYLLLKDVLLIIPLLSICTAILSIPVATLTYVLVVSDSKQLEEDNPTTNKICGGIMLVITITYFVLGFKYNLWHPYWLLFIIGGFICTIINKIVKK